MLYRCIHAIYTYRYIHTDMNKARTLYFVLFSVHVEENMLGV